MGTNSWPQFNQNEGPNSSFVAEINLFLSACHIRGSVDWPSDVGLFEC